MDERIQQRIVLYAVPVGSLFGGPEPEATRLYNEVGNLPDKVRAMLGAMRTGAFIRGLVKSYNLPVEKSASVAFNIVRIAVGVREMAQLPNSLASDLKLSSATALQIAQEIERDLFGPVRAELDSYLKTRAGNTPPSTPAPSMPQQSVQPRPTSPQPSHNNATAGTARLRGAGNVLNLKETPKLPPPPPMPPTRPALPSRPV